jgi:hypothetical protein
MNNILEHGIEQHEFQKLGDFGPGFYCADTVRSALQYATASALYGVPVALDALSPGRHGPMLASLIYFDVNNDELANLEQLDLDDGDEWITFTRQCYTEGGDHAAYSGNLKALQLVMGKLVNNPHEVERAGATSEAFEDARRQYMFRRQAGDLLLVDKENKVGAALFDVYIDIPENENNDDEYDGI